MLRLFSVVLVAALFLLVRLGKVVAVPAHDAGSSFSWAPAGPQNNTPITLSSVATHYI